MSRHLEATAVAAFSDELRQSLPAIAAALDAAAQDRSDRAAAHEAYRLVHALKGAASMVGLAALSHLLNLAEELLEGPVANGTAPSDYVVALVRESIPGFAEYMDAAMGRRPIEPIAIGLARALRMSEGDPAGDAALQELLDLDMRELASWQPPAAHPPVVDVRDALPSLPPTAPVAAEPELDLAPSEEVAPELAEVFAQEAQEHLETIARLTSLLSPAAQDRDSLQELRRAVHTLKGAAGVVGYKAASRLAHRMEDLLDRLYEGSSVITPEAVHALASSSDALVDLIACATDPSALRDTVKRLFAEFDLLLAGAAPPPIPAEHSVAVPLADADERAREPAPVRERRTHVDDRRRGSDDRRGGGQVLRVPIQRLNELVRAVSGLVINRSTFEQHHAALVEQVDELKFSAARLRKVAQKLEVDYEVRALAGETTFAVGSGLAAGPADHHGFDELEFDRYTEFHLLTRELAETANDVSTIGARVSDTIGDFDNDVSRLGRLTREIQDKTMEFRMVSLGTLAARLERAARVTAETCGKLVDFAIEGEHVALDKSLLEEMADPLLHLVRNAVDHGIESPAERRAAGKTERGRVTVRAYHEGTDVLIEVQDDGAGLDADRIRRAAVDKGLLTEGDAAGLAPDALHALVFEPGFSTASHISEISGRGIGMDIVKSKVARVHGRIQIASQRGAGATMSVRVPMTLAIARILLVRAGGETFGLPLGAVMQIVRPYPAAIGRVGNQPVVTLDGRTYPLRDLADTLGLPRSPESSAAQPVVVANLGGRQEALTVDEILHSRDAVVKTLGTHLRRVHGIWGATLLGDGTVVLILNPADLAGAADEPRVRRVAPRVQPHAEHQPYTILIVDDSLSMRHVLSTAVKKAGWNPLQARDGLEALEMLSRAPRPPDLVLLDIEMPRMDGYELLARVRAQPAHVDLPIVMLTSRGSAKHREKATSLGATDYMVKPFREELLIGTIDRLVKSARQIDERAAS